MVSLSLNYRNFPKRYIRDPRLGHRLGKNFPSGKHFDPTWGHSWLGTGPNGFYGQFKEIQTEKPSMETIRLMILGGSAAMGLGASSTNCVLANRLHAELSLISVTRKFEVLNCAVGDYSSTQSLLALITELIIYKPDIVVAIDGFNDFSHSTWGSKFSNGEWLPNTTRSFDDCLYAVQKWENRKEESVRKYARRISRSGILFGKILNRRNNVKTHGTHGMVWDNPVNWEIKEEAVSWYINNISMLAGIAAAKDFHLLHVIQPSILWTNRKPLTPEERKYRDLFWKRMPRLGELANDYYKLLQPRYETLRRDLNLRRLKKKILIENLAEVFDHENEACFTDPIHYNDFGQRLLGAKLAAILTRKNLIN
jgi:hypothetical protein